MTISPSDVAPRPTLRDPVHLLAFGFGAGLLRPAPGTWGTLVAVPIAWGLGQLALPVRCAVVLAIAGSGVWLCGRAGRDLGVADHAGIVWDEIAGYLLAVMLFEWSWVSAVLGFMLFRLFDIAKPPPVGWFDRRVHGGLGVMLDDLAAGVLTALVLGMLAWAELGMTLDPALGEWLTP